MLRDNVNYRTLNRFGLIVENEDNIQFYFEKMKVNTDKNCLNCRVTKEDLSQEICNKCVDYNKWI